MQTLELYIQHKVHDWTRLKILQVCRLLDQH